MNDSPKQAPPTVLAAQSAIAEMTERHGSNYRWLATITAMTGTLTTLMAATILNIVVPQVMETFAIPQSSAQWMLTGFLTAMTTAMLAAAWAMQTFGLRKAYRIGMGLFIFGSAIGATAQNFPWLVLGPIFQGLAAGLIVPMAMIVLYEVFPAEKRGKGMGLYGLGAVLGPSLAPVIGGFVVDWLSWWGVFVVVLPPAVVGLAMSRYLRGPLNDKPERLDFIGLGLLASGLLIFLWVTSRANLVGWHHWEVWTGLAGVCALVCGFLLRLKTAQAPILAPAVFSSRLFTAGFVLSAAVGAALFGTLYLVPLFLQLVPEMGPRTAGLSLLPAGLSMALTFPLAGYLNDRFNPRNIVLAGLALILVPLALFSFSLEAHLAEVMITLAISRIGLALVMPSLTAGSLRALPPALIFQGAGAINFARQLGGALGVAGTSLLVETAPTAASGYQRGFLGLFVLVGLAAITLITLGKTDQSTLG